LVVLNAGILPAFADLKDTGMADIKDSMQVNVWANKVLLDYLLATIPEIKQVIGISSGASQSGHRGWNAYAISKAALNMLLALYSFHRFSTRFNRYCHAKLYQSTRTARHLSNIKAITKC